MTSSHRRSASWSWPRRRRTFASPSLAHIADRSIDRASSYAVRASGSRSGPRFSSAHPRAVYTAALVGWDSSSRSSSWSAAAYSPASESASTRPSPAATGPLAIGLAPRLPGPEQREGMPLVLELEALVHLAQVLPPPVDLVVAVGGGELDAEADFFLGHERIRSHGHVDAAVEQEPADDVDVVAVRERDLDQRKPGLIWRVDGELVQALEDPAGLPVHLV